MIPKKFTLHAALMSRTRLAYLNDFGLDYSHFDSQLEKSSPENLINPRNKTFLLSDYLSLPIDFTYCKTKLIVNCTVWLI